MLRTLFQVIYESYKIFPKKGYISSSLRTKIRKMLLTLFESVIKNTTCSQITFTFKALFSLIFNDFGGFPFGHCVFYYL